MAGTFPLTDVESHTAFVISLKIMSKTSLVGCGMELTKTF